jgi:hypothetical protein
MSRKQSTAIGLFIPAALFALAVAWFMVRPHGAPPQPAPQLEQLPAAKQAEDARMITQVPELVGAPQQRAELVAGGKLTNGQWQFGYTPNPQATREFLKSLAKPTLAEAAPWSVREADDKRPVLLYRALYQAYAAFHGGQKFVVGQQKIGDCVSWGWAHGCDHCLAVEWKLGQSSEWRPAATEAIYGGSRVEARGVKAGGWGDGSYGGAAAKFVHDWGVLFRQPYPELGFDLTTYDGQRAKQWGNYGCGGSGDNGKAEAVAKKHPVRSVALVRNFEEAAAAIAAGYPVPVCSGQGFASRRDQQGFASASGSWAHCMCFVGKRGDRPGLLCLNSWGPNWISGPKWPEDQPDGSFWVDKAIVDRMLRGEDSFAVSAYEGFPYRDLKHGDWVEVRPRSARSLAGSGTPADGIFALAP